MSFALGQRLLLLPESLTRKAVTYRADPRKLAGTYREGAGGRLAHDKPAVASVGVLPVGTARVGIPVLGTGTGRDVAGVTVAEVTGGAQVHDVIVAVEEGDRLVLVDQGDHLGSKTSG